MGECSELYISKTAEKKIKKYYTDQC